MNVKSILLTVVIMLVYQVSFIKAQVIIKANEGGVMNLAEISAVILQQDEKVKVEFAAPAETRPKAYTDVDVQSGDFIIMANGKSIKHVKDLIKIYDNLEIGAELKMAIERGDKKIMVAFNKANPDDLPKRTMVKMHKSADGDTKIVESENMDEKEMKEILKKVEATDTKKKN